MKFQEDFVVRYTFAILHVLVMVNDVSGFKQETVHHLRHKMYHTAKATNLVVEIRSDQKDNEKFLGERTNLAV